MLRAVDGEIVAVDWSSGAPVGDAGKGVAGPTAEGHGGAGRHDEDEAIREGQEERLESLDLRRFPG